VISYEAVADVGDSPKDADEIFGNLHISGAPGHSKKEQP